MNNGEFEGRVWHRTIKFPAVDGLTPIEQSTLVSQIEKRMNNVQEKTGIADASKITIVVAYELAAELYIQQQKVETNRTADSRKVDEMIGTLETVLGK